MQLFACTGCHATCNRFLSPAGWFQTLAGSQVFPPERGPQMPHDKNGNQLKPGDQVIVRATVSDVHAGEEYCNVNLETDEPMFPGDHKTPITLNTKQVEKS